MKIRTISLTSLLIAALLILGGGQVWAQSGKSANPRFKNIGTNEKVLHTFNEMFAGATNIIWSKDEHNNDYVYCKNDGKVIRAGFDRKGKFLYSVSTFSEEQLPEEILLMIKKTYFGKSIFCVTEVNYAGKTAYLVDLEDRTSWLKVKVLGGEMTEERVLLKSKK